MSTSNQTLEERVIALEHEIQEMKLQLKTTHPPEQQAWWQKRAGEFKSDPVFDEIVEAGKAYRRYAI